MRTFATLLAGSAAGLLLAAGAQAGVCSGEIMALQKQMEETPTMASSTAPGSVPQTAGQTLGEATPGAEEMPDASGGTLVQTEDAPAPTAPMDADAADASQLNTAAGIDTTDTGATGTDAAAQALTRARALDQAGDEAGCMTAIEEAKGQLGQ